MTWPMIGGMERKIRTGPFILIIMATHAPPRVDTICTAPNGMLNRIVLKLSYPKPLMIKGPNVEMLPLGMLKDRQHTKHSRKLLHKRFECLRDSQEHRKPHPRLGIECGFFRMIPFPHVVVNALLVGTQSRSTVSSMSNNMQSGSDLSMATTLSSP